MTPQVSIRQGSAIITVNKRVVIALSILLAARQVCQQETNCCWVESVWICMLLAVSILEFMINIYGLRFWAGSWCSGIPSVPQLAFTELGNAWTASATLPT
ncbi:hypothetical protein N7G274_001671 [Stereocaulon virgatum]|uniref:Uncharacterized protein n=1 Tax=Stereocaulon virgatum TaxID=373712 RepID=A0ABR4AL34_9LECA